MLVTMNTLDERYEDVKQPLGQAQRGLRWGSPLVWLPLWLGCSPPDAEQQVADSGSTPVDVDGDGSPAGEDCDDGDANVYPTAPERCNGIDDDCDGLVDAADPGWDGAGGITAWIDADGDGYGDPASETSICPDDAGYVDQGGDCDDSDPAVSPAAVERCDGIDDDCDGLWDLDDPDLDPAEAVTVWEDADGDGYGDPATETQACTVGSGQVEEASDCDDASDDIHPGALEICNDGLDNDCSGDESGCSLSGFYEITDADVVFQAESDEELDNFGTRFAVLDLTGDGSLDYVISSPQRHDSRGLSLPRVYFFTGPLSAGELAAEDAVATWDGLDTSDRLGQALARAGDVDGDGFADLLIGSPERISAEGYGSAGTARLVYGGAAPDGSFDVSWSGTQGYEQVGGDVTGLGDLDGDGLVDIGIGAPGHTATESYAGAVFLFYGSTSALVSSDIDDAPAWIEGVVEKGKLGYVGSIGHGDLNGDGLVDLALGASHRYTGGIGTAWVVLGEGDRLSGELAIDEIDDWSYYGAVGNGGFGETVTADIDFDGDGYQDLAVDEPGAGGWSGWLYVFHGGPATPSGTLDASSEAWSMWGGSTLACMGQAVTSGDLDADGVDDLVVGAGMWQFATDDYRGAAFLYYGPLTVGTWTDLDADARFQGVETYDQAGYNHLAIVDANEDGVGDLLLSALGYQEQKGGVFGFFGGGP